MYSTTGTGAAHTTGAGAMYDQAGAVAMYSNTSAGVAIAAGAGVMHTGARAVYTAELAPRRIRLTPARCTRPLVLAPRPRLVLVPRMEQPVLAGYTTPQVLA